MPPAAPHSSEPPLRMYRGFHLGQRARSCAGILLMEAMVAVAILGLVAVGATHALLTANRLAASSRVWTSARAVVQRNLDTALTITFTQTSVPPILAFTSGAGEVWDDDGGSDNTVQIAVQDGPGLVVASGVLTRTVTAVANPDNADIRRVTFRLDYQYRGRPVSLAMSTMRSVDD
jgi:hypothetical protein